MQRSISPPALSRRSDREKAEPGPDLSGCPGIRGKNNQARKLNVSLKPEVLIEGGVLDQRFMCRAGSYLPGAVEPEAN